MDQIFIPIFPHFSHLFFAKIVLIRSWPNSVWSQNSASNFNPIFIFYMLPFYIIFHQNSHLYESDKTLTQFSFLYTHRFSPFFLIKTAIFYESDQLFIFIFPHFLQLFSVKIVLIRSWPNSVWSQSSASNFNSIFILCRLPFYIIYSPKQPFISIRQNFNPIFISIYPPFFTIFPHQNSYFI